MAAAIYLLLCASVAARGTLLLAGGTTDPVARRLVRHTLFFAAFLLGFHVLGAAQMLAGAPAVTTAHAAVLMLVAAAAVYGLSLRVPAAGTLVPDGGEWGWLPLLTVTVFVGVALMLACGFPRGFEVMAYHLPNAAAILQTQTLQAFDGNYPHTFPGNASVFFAVLLEALPERLVAAADLLLLIPLVAAVYGLCRLAGSDRKAALMAACGLLSVPMIAFSSVELGADIGGIAFISIAAYLVLCRQLPPVTALVLAGLCAGIAFGFKSLHLVTTAILGLLACAEGWQQGTTQRTRMLGAVRNGSLFGGMALLAAWFWLMRNGLAYGNPLHPVPLPLLGEWLGWRPAPDFSYADRATTEREWVSASWQWFVYPWTETQTLGQNFKHSSGLGAFVAAAIPATVIALAPALLREGFKAHRVRASLLVATALVLVIWWGLGDRQPRYALAALPFGLPLLAWTATQAQGKWRMAFDAILAMCIVAMLGVFFSRELLQFGDRIVLSRQTERARYYEYPPVLDALPAGSTILTVAARPWHYPLMGKGLHNRVVSMPELRRMLGMPPSLSPPAQVHLLAAPLRAAGVTHVFVTGPALTQEDCLRLDEVARLDRNPTNNAQLPQPRLVYRVDYSACR